MIIDDNFLTEKEIYGIEGTFLGMTFPWNLGQSIIGSNPDKVKNIDIYDSPYFYHEFYSGGIVKSEYIKVLLNILNRFCENNKVTYDVLLRAKANLTVQDFDVDDTQTPHVDHKFPHRVFIYYINDSDGNTIIYDKQYQEGVEPSLSVANLIQPKAGRGIMFDGLTYHSPTVPKLSGFRAVLNVTLL